MRRVTLRCLPVLLLVLLLAGCGVFPRRPMSSGAFTRQVAERIHQQYPALDVHVLAPLLLRLADRTASLPLTGLYHDYVKAPADQDSLISDFLQYAFEPRPPLPFTWDEANDRIVPLVEGAQTAPPAGGFVSTGVTDDLQAVLAMQISQGYAYLTQADLKQWGLQPEQAFAVAVQNLLVRTGTQAPLIGPTDVKGLFLSSWRLGDGLDSSRLLMAQQWHRSMRGRIEWQMLFIIPSNDEAVAFDGADPNAVKAVRKYAVGRFKAAAHPISNQVYVLTDTHLEVLAK